MTPADCCGSAPVTLTFGEPDGADPEGYPGFAVWCPTCRMNIYGRDRTDTIERWNQRSDTDQKGKTDGDQGKDQG